MSLVKLELEELNKHSEMSLVICRICGSNQNSLKYVFSEGNEELVDQIRLCANIQIDALDDLPKYVCDVCEQGLAFSYSLRKKGEETEKKLRQELLSKREDETYSPLEDIKEVLIEDVSYEQLWITCDAGDQHDQTEGLVERIEDEEEILEVEPKEECDESEEWIIPNDDLIETSEVIEEDVIDKVEEDIIELIEMRNQIETEMKLVPSTSVSVIEEHNFVSVHHQANLENPPANFKHFHCDLCQRSFRTVSHLNVHLKSHSKDKSYACAICGKKMRYQGNLRVHMRTIHSNITNDALEKSAQKVDLYVTQDIAKCLESMPDQYRKITKVYLHDKCKVFKCTVCGKISNFKATHVAHCRIHLNERPFKCGLCDKSFRQSATLKEHEVIHLGTKPYKCSMCESRFTQKSGLKKHEFWHLGEKPFECKACGLAFRNRAAFRVHERVHTGDTPYSCVWCRQAFREKRQLSKHQSVCDQSRDRDSESEERSVRFHCTWKSCKKNFAQPRHLITHMRIHLETSSNQRNVWECEYCYKSFQKAIHLWHHQTEYKGACVE